MKQNQNREKIVLYVAGAVTAGFLTWGIVTTVNKNKLANEFEEHKDQSTLTLQEKIDENNNLVIQLNTAQEDKKNLRATNAELTAKNNTLEENATYWNWMYDQKDAEYNQEAALSEAYKEKVDSFQVVTSDLEAALKEKEAYISGLRLDIDSLANEQNKYVLANQALNDSILSMWNVFNPFIVRSWCFKGDKQDKVYFPVEESRIPTTKEEFKEIKALNRQYKNEQ
jgi:hypothetical protein